jgi:GNAT superfamily N-acetyltransferase
MDMRLQIRRLDRSDAALLREIRIQALQDAPREFGETLAEALSRSDEDWSDLAAFAHVAEIEGRWVGMTFAFQDALDPEIARVGGMWVAPDARRAGVGSQLLEAVRTWAITTKKRRIRLWVNPGTAAEKLYRRASFVPSGAQKPFPGDGARSLIEMGLEIDDD